MNSCRPSIEWPMQFDVSVGVQKDDTRLLKQIDGVFARRKAQIDRLLASYRVPIASPEGE